MAELIKKDALEEELRDMVYNAQNADELYCEVKNLVYMMPTVTEADIRAKAITVMSKAMKEFYPSCKGAYVIFDVFFCAVMAKVAERLKEE